MKMRYITLILLTLIIGSCSEPKQQENREELTEEMEARQLKRVKEGEILKLATDLGKEIADKSQKELSSQLSKAIQENGLVYAVEFCNANAYSLLDSLRADYNVSIKRATLKPRNYDDEANDLEKQILEAYQYNIDNGIKLEDNIQKVGNDQLLYSRPIVIKDAICLSCHGNPGFEIKRKTMYKINELYPRDLAIGHRYGDLRGMWSITFNKKDLVNML